MGALKGEVRRRPAPNFGYEGRIRYFDARRWTPCPAGLSFDQACAWTRGWQRHVTTNRLRAPTALTQRKTKKKKAGGEIVRMWLDRWYAARRADGLTSVGDDESRMTHHVLDVVVGENGEAFGDLPIRDVSVADIEAIRESLDAKIRCGDLAWKSAENVWMVLRAVFRDCNNKAKRRELRARDDNPMAGMPAPDRGSKRAKQYLYPSEFLTFADCNLVPVRWRRIGALLVYLWIRSGELAALEWGDIDVEHLQIDINKAIQADGTIGPPKNGESRRVTIYPALVPLLEQMKLEAGGKGLVTHMPQKSDAAAVLRAYLVKAGVTRAALHNRTSTQAPLTMHDLRATGITWAAIASEDMRSIQRRAGHKSITTTEIYIHEADAVRAGFGDVFPPLPASILDGTAVGTPSGRKHRKGA